jgi:hypothetical protein
MDIWSQHQPRGLDWNVSPRDSYHQPPSSPSIWRDRVCVWDHQNRCHYRHYSDAGDPQRTKFKQKYRRWALYILPIAMGVLLQSGKLTFRRFLACCF